MTGTDIFLIVGAGPAGCAAAFDLAEAGARVLLLDRRAFPRHKACACGLTRKTLKALRYPVTPVVERWCGEMVLEPPPEDFGGTGPNVPPAATPPRAKLRLRDRQPIAAMAVRERFDAYCLERTLQAGKRGGSVTFRKIESIAALRETGAGVELDIVNADGSPQRNETLRAAVAIGADGSNGQMRRLAAQLAAGEREALGAQTAGAQGSSALGAEPAWYTRGFALEAMVPYTALPAALPERDGPHDLLFDFSPLPGGYGWLFPKGDHINIGVGAFAAVGTAAGHRGASEADLKQVTRALLAAYTQRKLGVALEAAGGAVTGQSLGMGGQRYVPRGRVLLAGDAAGLVDPLTGEGIHSAMVSGQAAAAAIVACRKRRTGEKSGAEMAGAGLDDVAAEYARRLRPLQRTLAFSERAARSFYREPGRGFKVMQTPLVGKMVLKTYADGLPVRYLGPLVRLAAGRKGD